MAAEIKYTIKGDPRTKKNHMMIAGAGSKCPVCKKPSKQWIRQGSFHDEYSTAAKWQLIPRPPKPIECPVNVKCVFYMETRRRVDKSNLEASIHDILVDAGILADDNRDVIATTDGSMVLYDKGNPRVEITITKLEGYEQWGKKSKTCKGASSEDGPLFARLRKGPTQEP